MGQYISSFLDEEIEFNKYGWKRDFPDHRDLLKVFESEEASLIIDLREQMPGIYDQKQIGSSVANAVAAAYEYNQIKIDDDHIFIPSKLFIYYNTRKIENTTKYDAGAQIRNSIKTLNMNGICSETKWNYHENNLISKPNDECYVSITPIKYFRIKQNLKSLKTCLENQTCFIFGFSVYENFKEMDDDFILTVPNKKDRYLGGHCALCVGFDEYKQIFIIRNSFGVEWGDNGYFYMTYDYLLNKGLCSDFWIIEN